MHRCVVPRKATREERDRDGSALGVHIERVRHCDVAVCTGADLLALQQTLGEILERVTTLDQWRAHLANCIAPVGNFGLNCKEILRKEGAHATLKVGTLTRLEQCFDTLTRQ